MKRILCRLGWHNWKIVHARGKTYMATYWMCNWCGHSELVRRSDLP